MQNQPAQNPPYSFLVVPTSLQFFAFLSLNPAPNDALTLSSEPTFNSLSFLPSQVEHLYCTQDRYTNLLASTTSLAEPRPEENQPQIQTLN
jgi:hypothetical protein